MILTWTSLRRRCFYLALSALLFVGVFCLLLRAPTDHEPESSSPEFKIASVDLMTEPPLKRFEDYRMVEVSYAKHDSRCFTQGLEFLTNAILAVSCGLYSQSRVYLLNIKDGQVLFEQRLPAKYFAEGLTLLRASRQLLLLTWKEKEALLLDPRTLKIRDIISYPYEGWGVASFGRRSTLKRSRSRCLQGGLCFEDTDVLSPEEDSKMTAAYIEEFQRLETTPLTNKGNETEEAKPIIDLADPEVILTTNGTEYLMHFELRDREMVLIHSVPVKINGVPVRNLNEIERVDARTALVNIWYDSRILHVDIWSGEILGISDLSALVPGNSKADVLNGVAVRPSDRSGATSKLPPIWVTGKLWSFIYRVKFA